MIKVHIVFNAHLDPVWLWSWRDGLDEVLNTCYYMCNLLDRNPDIIYTRGEAWVYEQIRDIDPVLFKRIQDHVKAGRWSIVGGWYIQPDCNLPSGFAMRKQIETGKKFFQQHFGLFPSTGYNVDSFGHAATLPRLLREAGQSSYVMMRPQEHEMALPARIFRWKGYADGPEITTFRIAKAYCTPEGMNEEHVRAAASELPAGVNHTMCYVGVGDHGGGPTEEMIAWCRENKNSFPGIELEFSSPQRFFEAIANEHSRLPLVVGELQQHAVGCYSVHRPVKVNLRKAEHRLTQAGIICGLNGEVPAEVEKAWEHVLFHHFHDTLGGTCLPSAYVDVEAQLGHALSVADQAGTIALRRQLVQWEEDPAQRMVFFNASETAFDGFVEVEPWMEWSKWRPSWGLVDEKNQPVAFEEMAPETGWINQVRLLFRLKMKAGGFSVVKIVDHRDQTTPALQKVSCRVSLEEKTELVFSEMSLPLPALNLFDDLTDTWSHGIERFERSNPVQAVWEKSTRLDQGPLMTSVVQKGKIGKSELSAEWRTYQGEVGIELRLRVLWTEERKMLKLEWAMPKEIAGREDGILGGSLERKSDGRELPLRDWTLLKFGSGSSPVAIVAPEVYALDGDASRVGLTLLRSCVMACHEPNPGTHARAIFSDQGAHEFRFRFLAGQGLTAEMLDGIAQNWHRPPLTADLTRGMKNRALREQYSPAKIG